MSNLTLQFPTESAYLDYSKVLCGQLKNIKLNVLREAMANADNFKTIRSYRTALKKQEVPTTFSARIYRQDEYLYFDALHALDHGIKFDGIEVLNDYIERTLIGSAYGMQAPDAEHEDGDMFRCTGYINIKEVDDENIAEAIAFFTEQYGASLALTIINQIALHYASDYLSQFADNIHHEMDIELDMVVELNEYTLLNDHDLLRSVLPIDAISYYEGSIRNELGNDEDFSLQELRGHALKDCWEAVLSMVIQQLASAFLVIANKGAVTGNDFKLLSDEAIKEASEFTLRKIILNQF